jgi:hypothetical protein
MAEHLFRAYRYEPDPAHAARPAPLAFFVESTAPDDIDADDSDPAPVPGLNLIDDPDQAIDQIAEHLCDPDNADPTLIVYVHGYSTPRPDVLARYHASFETVHDDDAIMAAKPVCVGYRWPSEAIGTRFLHWLPAAPLILGGLFWIGIALAIYYVMARYAFGPLPWWLLAKAAGIIAVVCLVLPLASLLLRGIVYFRDNYRATQYGVPDLVEVIRQIDTRVVALARKRGRRHPKVSLSFLGHSMGAYVVTNAMRVLSDVFKPEALRHSLNEGVVGHPSKLATRTDRNAQPRADDVTFVPSDIGHVFKVARMVLVSPDIPAEALISNRANFLEASLRRFEEAYLFSNGEDEVLRQISTVANSFSFPTRSWKYGFRLGNVEVISRNTAAAPRRMAADSTDYMRDLRIGYFSLQHLYDNLHIEMVQNALPLVFSYFDCTDYAEGGKRFLSLVDRKVDAQGNLAPVSPFQHIRLLVRYALRAFRWAPDVHSGYFDPAAKTTNRLIHRLACLGAEGTSRAFSNGNDDGGVALHAACRGTGIQVLLSPYVGKRRTRQRRLAQAPEGLGQPAPPDAPASP